eukprot:s1332_g22.t1
MDNSSRHYEVRYELDQVLRPLRGYSSCRFRLCNSRLCEDVGNRCIWRQRSYIVVKRLMLRKCCRFMPIPTQTQAARPGRTYRLWPQLAGLYNAGRESRWRSLPVHRDRIDVEGLGLDTGLASTAWTWTTGGGCRSLGQGTGLDADFHIPKCGTVRLVAWDVSN